MIELLLHTLGVGELTAFPARPKLRLINLPLRPLFPTFLLQMAWKILVAPLQNTDCHTLDDLRTKPQLLYA